MNYFAATRSRHNRTYARPHSSGPRSGSIQARITEAMIRAAQEYQESHPGEAVAFLVDSTVRSWVVPSCPHCGKTHYHGAGKKGEDAYEYLGFRVPHCTYGGSTYTLVELPK